MRPHRRSIAGLMAVVVLVAVDCAAIRSPLRGQPLTSILLLLGGLPMANILALDLLPALRARSGRGRPPRGLIGFELIGGAALLLYAIIALSDPDWLFEALYHAVNLLWSVRDPSRVVVLAVFLLLPQLSLGLLGGWLNAKYGLWSMFVGDRVCAEEPSTRLA